MSLIFASDSRDCAHETLKFSTQKQHANSAQLQLKSLLPNLNFNPEFTEQITFLDFALSKSFDSATQSVSTQVIEASLLSFQVRDGFAPQSL